MHASDSHDRPSPWWSAAIQRNIGLQRRIMMYVAMGSLAGLLFFGLVAQNSLETSTSIIYEERLHLARLVAHDLAKDLEATGPDGRLVVLSPERIQERLVAYSMAPIDGSPMFHLSLVDRTGDIILESHTIPNQNNDEHKVLLEHFLGTTNSDVIVHRPAKAPDKVHMVAYVPLPGLPGGVTFEQMHETALVVPRALGRDMSMAGALFIATGLVLAWLTTSQVVSPLTQLTAVTRKIAAGDLSTPVRQRGKDEIRDLAASFETMRQRLWQSLADLEQANRELENRVQERTAELEERHTDLSRATSLLVEREAERTFLLQKTIQAQEDERRRVARELHDTVAQFLSLVVLRLSVLEAKAQDCPHPVAAALSELRSRTSQAVDDVRRLIADLRPELLDDLGLSAALSSYAEQVLSSQGITVELDVNVTTDRLSPLVELVVFRVMQEAITNVFKHADAQQVRISLRLQEGALVGTVADDGVGFERSRSGLARGEGAVGLLGMRERIALIGGTLQIMSVPGEGTEVVFRIMMDGEEDAA